jgi:hypothetical protein
MGQYIEGGGAQYHLRLSRHRPRPAIFTKISSTPRLILSVQR